MKKALLVATTQTHIIEFHKPLVKYLKDKGMEVHVAAGNNLSGKDGICLDFVDKVFDISISRSPRSFENYKALKQLKRIIKEESYDLIQCNTPMGGILTRMAAKRARKKGTKVIYMAHGFHFCKGAPKKNWLLYYPIEKYFAKKCDVIITITDEDYLLASSKFKTNVVRMHGVGVYEERYHPIDEKERSYLREKAGLSSDDYVIVCVGEFNANKNQKVLVSAISKIKDKIPNIKLLFAGSGRLMDDVKKQVEELGLNNMVQFLGYRRDLETIVPASDLVVSCSYREGLPLNIVEAMLSKKPIVASINRGHKELVIDGQNGYLFDPSDAEQLSQKILKVFNGDSLAMGERSCDRAQSYTVSSVKEEISQIYGDVLGEEKNEI